MTIKHTELPEIMTAGDVAKVLKITPHTVYRRHRDGDLPGIRIGGAVRFRAEDIKQLLTEGVKPDEN